MNREQLAARAIELCGGASGYTEHFDPQGFFRLVTEGLQTDNDKAIARWQKADPATRGKKPFHFSACQFLASRLALEACEMKRGMKWCNRADGGNTRIPGLELIRIKQHAAYAWKTYAAQTPWDIGVGDAVEVNAKLGPHTFVVTAVHLDGDVPATLDRAEYGQFLDPDGPQGPEPADDGAHTVTGSIITRGPTGWKVNGSPIIGRLSIIALKEHELATPDDERPTDPTPSPRPDTPPPVDKPFRILKRGMNDDPQVRAAQSKLAAGQKPNGWPSAWRWPMGVDGDFGERTEFAVRDFKTRQEISEDCGVGEIGVVTWRRLGLA